jgi:REP element-mobilizing transposase RayT
MWNDRDIPLAYLITFRCYGTWLHGDDRGSVDREHRRYRSPYAVPSANRRSHNYQTLKSEPVVLSARQRASIEHAIGDTCSYRKWHLYACNVRTNHVHAVVAIGAKRPELALNALKANATRQMREDGCWQHSHSPWVDRGSKRYLWNERSVELAVDYVLYGHGNELPDFD